MRSVTMAMPIQFNDQKCHIKKQKSHKTALFNYYACLSCDLLLILLRADTHTHTLAFADETISKNQVHAGHRLAHTWFKIKKFMCLTNK